MITSTHAEVKDAVKAASAGGGAVRIKVCSRAHADGVIAAGAAPAPASTPAPAHVPALAQAQSLPVPAAAAGGGGAVGVLDVASLAAALKPPSGSEAVVGGEAASSGAGTPSTEPCTSYRLDMKAAIFGMCKCGFPKQEHKTTEAAPARSSKPPKARPYGISAPTPASVVPKPAPFDRTGTNEALPVPKNLSPTSSSPPSTSPIRATGRPKPRPVTTLPPPIRFVRVCACGCAGGCVATCARARVCVSVCACVNSRTLAGSD